MKNNETTNYVIENGIYVGMMVNLPIIVQAKSLKEMKRRIKSVSATYIKMLQKTIDTDSFIFIKKSL